MLGQDCLKDGIYCSGEKDERPYFAARCLPWHSIHTSIRLPSRCLYGLMEQIQKGELMKIRHGYFVSFVLESSYEYTKRKNLRLCLLDRRSEDDKIFNTACE